MLVAEGIPADIISGDFTILYCLPHEKFTEVLKDPDFADDYENYCMLRDKLLHDKVKDEIVTICVSCGSHSHSVDSCPLVTYVPNRYLAVRKYWHSPQ